MQDTLAKKIFAVGSAAAMTLSLVAPLAAHAAADGAGTNVSSPDGTIWMITANGTRRAYTSAGAFLSYGFNSWSNVVPASSEDLALPVDPAGFIPPQDGKIFCATSTKGSDVKGECSLITGGMKAAFTSASVFTGLGFSFSRAQNGDSSFLTKTANITNTTSAHLPGVLVHFSVGGHDTVFLVGQNSLMGIPDLATFNSWGFSFADVVPANAADQALPQSGVMAARQPGQLSPSVLASTGGNTGCTTNCGTPVVNGSVSAMLASDTPAAGTLVSATTGPGQTGADLAHFMFSGTGTVTQVVVNRIGVSSDTSINNVYLYMGNNRITDAGSFSNGMVTFSNSNGLFTVNGSAEVSVRVDVATNISGQTVGAQLSSYTVANGSPMSASISGNLFQIALISNLATVQLTGTTDTSINGPGATVNAGVTNQLLWGETVNVGQRAVQMKYIAFKQIGSISQNAIQNLKLMVDGAQVGQTTSIMNSGSNTNVVIFDLTGSPVTLQTGGHTLELHGDIIAGTSYNFEFSLQQAADSVFFDTNYSVNVPLTWTGGAALFQAEPSYSGNTIFNTTINSGSVSVQSDPSFTTTQFVKNASQVNLGQWTMKAYGEDVKVQNLQVQLNLTGAASSSVEGFNNLSLYVNGGQVGSSLSALGPSSGTYISATYTFGSTNLFTIPAGSTVTVAVKGDSTFLSNTLVTAVQAVLITPVNSLQGVTSYSQSGSGQTYTAPTLSLTSSSATLAKNTAYSNQTVGSNVTKQKIGSFVIQANNADGLRVNSLSVVLGGSTSPTALPNSLANLYIVTPDQPNGTTPVNPSSSNTFSVNFTVPANQTATVDVYADVSNVTGTITTSLYGSGVGSTSAQAVSLASSGSPQLGQTITVGNGTVATPTLQTSSPVASFVVGGGSTSQPVATFNFTASNGGVTIQELDFQVTNASGTAVGITGLTIGSVSSTVVGASSTVTGLNIVVPANFSGIDVPVTGTFATVGQNGVPTNQQFRLDLIRVKYLSGSTTTYLPSGGTTYATQASSNWFDLVGSYPTVTLASAGNTLSTGNVTVGSITVAANAGGNVKVTQIPLTISASSGVTATGTLQLIDSTSGQVAGTVAIASSTTSVNVTLTAQNNIAASTSKVYNIVVPVTNVTGTSYSLSIGMGAQSAFIFTDVNGNASVLGASTTGSDSGTNFLVNYPTNTATAHQ